jgi:hypothetical protein
MGYLLSERYKTSITEIKQASIETTPERSFQHDFPGTAKFCVMILWQVYAFTVNAMAKMDPGRICKCMYRHKPTVLSYHSIP